MDRINGLPDDLLVKILSFVPTKIAVSTSILSKRWRFFLMWLPKLEYEYHPTYRLEEFINKNLPLHRAPVIERLCFDSFGEPENVKRWIEIAVSRYLRELKISWNTNIMFPNSFYTCKSLVILKLFDFTLMDVPSLVCFPSLETLEVEGVTYIDNSFLQTLLSSCPVLEELLFLCGEEDINEFSIVIPSLQSLSLCLVGSWNFKGYEIDTPSLKYLKLEDLNCLSDYNVFKNMPKLREAYINILFLDINSLIGSILSVKRLTICSIKDGYDEGFVFNELQHLKLCPCHKYPLTLLAQLLKDSPKLRVLDLSYIEHHLNDELHSRFRWNMFRWNEPSSVPECLLSSLQLFNWSPYFGRPEDREIVVYILKNAHCLKTAIILADTVKHLVPNLKMIKELTLSSRASRTCELVFIEDYRSI